jgi:hypothetical protein
MSVNSAIPDIPFLPIDSRSIGILCFVIVDAR